MVDEDPTNSSLVYHLPCTLLDGLADGLTKLFLVGGDEAYQTLNNISSVNQLVTVQHDGQPYVFLGDIGFSSSVDFSASTIAINTQCKPITRACNAVATDTTTYNCSNEFQGDLDPTSGNATTFETVWRMNLFTDAALDEPAEFNNSYITSTNPVYIAMATTLNGDIHGMYPNGTLDMTHTILNDPEILKDNQNSLSFILLCNATVYDATYTWINGSFGNFTDLNPSNETFANIVNGPQEKNSTFGINQFANGAILSTFSDDAQILADKMALVYSKTSLGLAAGVFTSRPNREEQTREEFLVSRVPMAPFYTLIIFNLMYAFIGGVVAVFALRASWYCVGVTETRAGLSVWGVVAHSFESTTGTIRKVKKVEDLFEESHDANATHGVIGIEKGDSARWRFRTWQKT